MAKRSYYDKEMDLVKEFAKDCPKGFSELSSYIANLKDGRIFVAKDYEIIFNTLMETESIAEALSVVNQRGVSCSTKNPLEKIVKKANQYISRYEYYHPRSVYAYLSSHMQNELKEKLNAMLVEYGLEVANINELSCVTVKKINEERFESNESVDINDDGIAYPEEINESKMYPLK